jgi:hypothetical protein
VSNCKHKQSCGYDGVNIPLVKSLISYTNILAPLTYICNKSFESGVFPNQMKIANILPLFKNSNEFFNYRPVSILPQFKTILEK